jgi:hypothetical protein
MIHHTPLFWMCSEHWHTLRWNWASSINKKFWEELIAYFPLIWHRSHRKVCIQQFFYCCMCIYCCGNVSAQPLPTNNRGDTYKLTTEELLEAVFSLWSDLKLYKEENSPPLAACRNLRAGRPNYQAISTVLLWLHYSGFHASCHITCHICLHGIATAISSGTIILAFRS